jgi:hypothetical protein
VELVAFLRYIIAMTWVEVASDTVKIGLGSLLTLLGGRLAFSRDVRRENTKRKIEGLFKASEAIQAAHNKLFRLHNVSESKLDFDEAFDAVRHDLSWAQASLLLLGASDTEKEVTEYVAILSKHQTAIKTTRGSEEAVELLTKLSTQRRKIFDALRVEIDRAASVGK